MLTYSEAETLERITLALERIAAVAEKWVEPVMLVDQPVGLADPPEPDWTMPDEAPVAQPPRVYRLSGDDR